MTKSRTTAMVRSAWLRPAATLTGAAAFIVTAAMAPLPDASRRAALEHASAAPEHERVFAELERRAAAGDPITLDWKTMAALDYRTGEMPESLRKLHGAEVRVPGFMVPLEDTETRVTEFLLVPFFGACIHVPPPPPNQMAHVLMARNQVVDVNLWDPIWVVGTLKIENVESPYGVVGYQVTGQRILPYEN